MEPSSTRNPASLALTLPCAASTDTAVTWAGVVAVVAVNTVSVGYIYYAFCIEDLDAEDEATTKKVK
jgi:hypothetical protein